MKIPYIIGLLLAASPAFGGEFAVLGNGFRLHADHHETDGSVVRLFEAGGTTEVPAAAVLSFEQEETRKNEPIPALPTTQVVVPAPVAVPATPAELAARAAQKFELPEAFVKSVMRAESAFKTNALSAKGAMGLMQLMPGTAQQLGVNPGNPSENAEGGARYLRDLLARYENSPDQVLLALAAYNAGPGAVEKYHGVPPYRETREYILRILKGWNPALLTPASGDSRNK